MQTILFCVGVLSTIGLAATIFDGMHGFIALGQAALPPPIDLEARVASTMNRVLSCAAVATSAWAGWAVLSRLSEVIAQVH